MRPVSGSILVGLATVTLVAATTNGVLARPPDMVAALGDSLRRAEAIDDDIEFRKALHFKSARSYVEGLYDNPATTVGTRANGALFTRAELAELQARDALDSDIAIIEDYYRRKVAKRRNFSGLYVDHAAGGVLAVYLKEGARAEWRRAVPHSGRIVVRKSEFSLAELEDIRADVTDAAVVGHAATRDLVEIAIDVPRNRVGLGFRPRALTGRDAGDPPAAFADRFGTRQFHAYPQDPPSIGTAIKGGWSYFPQGCSFGLKVDKSDAADPDDRFMISAGHCFSSLPAQTYHNGNWVGPGFKKKFHANAIVDAALIRIEDETTNPHFVAGAKVVHVVSGVPYVLEVKAKVGNHAKGKTRCMTGRTTGTKCGVIERSSASIFLAENGFYLHDLVKVKNLKRQDGDSGGPAYWHNTATNVVKGAGVLSSKDTANKKAWYSKIGRIEALSWNVRLATLSNANGCKIPGSGGSGTKCPIDQGGDY